MRWKINFKSNSSQGLDFYFRVMAEIFSESADKYIKASSCKIIIGFPEVIQDVVSCYRGVIMLQKIDKEFLFPNRKAYAPLIV